MVISVLVELMVKIVGSPVAVESEAVHAGGSVGVFRIIVVAQLIRPEMPFADITCLVAVLIQYMGKARVIGVHPDFVYDHSRAA